MSSTPSLVTTLQHALAEHAAAPVLVAFSGGPDSTALLHALARIPEARSRGLRAIHVDHGMQPQSHAWADHCRALGEQLDVAVTVHRVSVTDAGDGPEAAARDARYTALLQDMEPGACLVTAHHRDDQAETVLLRLMRGSGPQGVGAMRPWQAWADGWLWRPLLATPRRALAEYVHQHRLAVIDDPANDTLDSTRNFLRHDILPRLENHRPGTIASLARSARLQSDAAAWLEQQASATLDSMPQAADDQLPARQWLELAPALRGAVLDQWLHARGLPVPDLAQRGQLCQQIHQARHDRVPLVQWPGGAIHVWRGRLFAHRPMSAPESVWRAPWRGEPITLADDTRLRLQPREDTALPELPALTVTQGETGVRLQPSGAPHTRHLTALLAAADVPPWRRPFWPLIRDAEGELLAVADRWFTPAGEHWFAKHGCRPLWQPPA